MDKIIKITASDPTNDLDEYIVNLFITRTRSKRLGTLWLDNEQDAKQISKAITALPELMIVMEHWKGMQNSQQLNAESTQLLHKMLNEKLQDAYNKINS